MRGFAAVFGREVSEWWKSLAVASLALGTLAAVLPLFMDRPEFPVAELRSAMSLLFAFLLSAALALLLGGSVVSSDLSEKRLGFYFARPLPGWALWTGKMTAAAALACGGGLLVLVPSLLLLIAIYILHQLRKRHQIQAEHVAAVAAKRAAEERAQGEAK